MSWSAPVLLRIATAYVVGALLVKPLVDTYPQRTLVLLQFAGCFGLALPVALTLQQLHDTLTRSNDLIPHQSTHLCS